MLTFLLPLTIELGGIRIVSSTPVNEVIVFLVTLIGLTSVTAFAMWRSRRAAPDPFI